MKLGLAYRVVLAAACLLGAAELTWAANSFYNASGAPAQGSALSSSVMRTEFANIGAGFDKMPALTAGTAIVVNGGGTALTNTVGTLALAGNFSTTGAFNTVLAQQASGTFTLPAATDTLVGRASTDTLTNKTISGASNTLSAIGNASLTNSSVTIGSTNVALGGTAATISGLTLTSPTLTTPNIGAATGTTLSLSHLAMGSGYSVVAGSVGNNFSVDSLSNIEGKRLFVSWNAGDGFAELVIASNGVVTVIASSNALGNNNAFDTTNNTSSNGGQGIAIFNSGATVFVQTKTSGWTGTVKIGMLNAQ